MESIFRKVVLPVGEYEISLEHPVRRYAGNPVLSAHDVNTVWKEPHLKVVTTHNAGIAVFQEKVIMLFRAHLRNGISVIGQARSSNGLTDWEIHPELFLKPDGTEGERGGVGATDRHGFDTDRFFDELFSCALERNLEHGSI